VEQNSWPTPMETIHRKVTRKNALHQDNVEGKDGLTADLMAPWDPYFLEPPARSNLDLHSYTRLVIEVC
jgi:hypothetical protein